MSQYSFYVTCLNILLIHLAFAHALTNSLSLHYDFGTIQVSCTYFCEDNCIESYDSVCQRKHIRGYFTKELRTPHTFISRKTMYVIASFQVYVNCHIAINLLMNECIACMNCGTK